MPNQSQYVLETMLRIIHKSSELITEPRVFGTEVLYASEIHMIDIIGRNPGIHVTEIANKLGITKGAVPKIICKLLQKELIYRYQAKDNKKMVLFTLTPKGHASFQSHIEFHKKLDQGIIKKFNSLQESELLMFHDIMHEIEEYIDRIEK
ncbi:MarR family transcriptional regulator [Pelosinus fermentans]|uniref:Transcriptional regulator, MarR family n=1 Tax=Pelosinus fermentans JBW45 TaxID=1192197 RepID=I9NSA7_9FIRM|nr:MarR family transcriptional regulator [Pelosinus fermentans]AJQ29328.1 transcriptional regulator, MarR family [Pelosinus fermentans JBW45]